VVSSVSPALVVPSAVVEVDVDAVVVVIVDGAVPPVKPVVDSLSSPLHAVTRPTQASPASARRPHNHQPNRTLERSIDHL
jgi:hypothetical protein